MSYETHPLKLRYRVNPEVLREYLQPALNDWKITLAYSGSGGRGYWRNLHTAENEFEHFPQPSGAQIKLAILAHPDPKFNYYEPKPGDGILLATIPVVHTGGGRPRVRLLTLEQELRLAKRYHKTTDLLDKLEKILETIHVRGEERKSE